VRCPLRIVSLSHCGTHLEVPEDDASAVQVLQRQDDLGCVEAGMVLTNPAGSGWTVPGRC
jgi:hypothetical protein